MSKNELIVTDNIWYKICNFFRKIFSRNNNKKIEKILIQTEQIKNNSFKEDILYRHETTIFNRKKELAEKLMNGLIEIDDLSNHEVVEMTEYFNMYINEMNQKLEQIKK